MHQHRELRTEVLKIESVNKIDTAADVYLS